MSYSDLHRQFSPDVEAEIEAALERLGSSSDAAKNAVAKLLQHQKLKHPLSVLPLLVHAIETGTPTPAVPVSAVHVLWWTSACYLDDLADGHAVTPAGDFGENEALLASVISGNMLPIQIIQSQQVPESVRSALTAELVNGWIVAAEGQLVDIRGDVGSATRKSAITAYRGKSGGPFGMITAMAATLSGAKSERIELWREFGYVFGVLWQIFNDQEDILSGRNEDLMNGTVTYLLACAIEEASPHSRERILGLCAASRNSGQARSELTDLLLAPANLHQYREDVDEFRDEAYRVLGELGGDEDYLPVLRQLVDLSAQMLLQGNLPH
ncbi:polyprenyl synthetase family protein [Streptomyces sp. A3M-1-3]|uniref:polyprenyl synthetase family protein n=1 Tax=Streptomyces sp. A3M-1-3 TaxID=2962044 RepID=UPI0020B66A2C|nr:polyprenyl synthetase family protein [Streptomyces sp. A3M-1-3]MCP3818752.1 polyprenyl synthetase family protein [Streptomyces sp. A3M-1-3]